MPFSAALDRDDARAMGRVQSLAGADGPEWRRDPAPRRHAGLSGGGGLADRRDGGGGGAPRLRGRDLSRRADRAADHRHQDLRSGEMSASAESFPLRRREIVAAILAERGDMLVVAGLGSAAWDVTEAEDHPLNFPLWGAMGGAIAMGLALALAPPAPPTPL